MKDSKPGNDYLPPSSSPDHVVSQGMTMVAGGARRGPGGATFPGGPDSTGAGGQAGAGPGAGVLSPRSSDSSGLGVKMVEYVLGTSPSAKDGVESRMRALVLVSVPVLVTEPVFCFYKESK